jgi:PAS domain S-box-containing protein
MFSPSNLAEVLGKINDGICVFNELGDAVFVNERAAQLLDGMDEEFRQKIKTGFIDQSARRFEHFQAGLNRWFEHQTYPNSDGSFVLISRDITSRHRIEEALRSSEERFRRVIESNIIGVIVVEAGFITEANDVFLKMGSWTRKDLLTRKLHWREMTPSEYDPADTKARLELNTAGVFSPYEKEFFRKDGTRVPVLISGVTIQGPPNTPETLCLAMDLSERRRAEERLRSLVECGKILASSLECENTLPEFAEFIVSRLVDSFDVFVQENHRFVKVASARRAPLQQSIEFGPALLAVSTSGKPEVILSPTSRALVPIMARGAVTGILAVSSGKPFAFDGEDLHLFDELARRIGLALENARMYHETQRANRLKDEFVAIVSHELRTPLTPILGGVYMLRAEPANENVLSRALDLIERNAKTQVKIVDDLLEVSRALSGKLRLKMESVDLKVVLRAAVETVRPAFEAKGIRIDLNLSPVGGVVSGDADRLQQVFWNLLANAVKFTPNQGRIRVELMEVAGYVEVRVMDTGVGIDPEFLPHVFEKFRQADTSRTRIHGGMGLGLAIVQHLVESHGGTVEAVSPGDDQGSTFTVRLPLRPTAHAAVREN